jgi:hypothetical protein
MTTKNPHTNHFQCGRRRSAAAAGLAVAASLAVAAMPASAAISCGYTPFTASTSILVKKSGSITCLTAKIKMRAYLRTDSAPRGWRCNNNRTDYYLCSQRDGDGRAYGRLDTTSGE